MEYKLKSGNTLRVTQDDDYSFLDSPRTWDNLAKMIFFGGKKSYGDDHDITLNTTFDGRHDFIDRGAEILKKKMNAAIVTPVHYYNHSGEGISTSFSYPYDCPWDSGTIGFAVITKEAIRKEYNVKRITKQVLELANSVLEAEVETLNKYISGEIYHFAVIDPEGNVVDSCGGFYGGDIKTNGMLDHIDDEILE